MRIVDESPGKKRIKCGWARFCRATGISTLHCRVRRRVRGSAQVVILLYHRVIPASLIGDVCSLPDIVVTRETFARQMAFLAKSYRVLALDEYVRAAANREALPGRTAVVTFDDGWRDNWEFAFPVLKRYGVPATIFLTTGFIGEDRMFWQEKLLFLLSRPGERDREMLLEQIAHGGEWSAAVHESLHRFVRDGSETALISGLTAVRESERDRLAQAIGERLGNPEFPRATNAFMGWEQVREMARAGVAFGAHSESHNLLTELPGEQLAVELERPAKAIEEKLGLPTVALAYPNGNVNEEVVKAARAAGYEVACTTRPGLNDARTDPLLLRRVNISEGRFRDTKGAYSEALFDARLCGLL